MGLLSNGNITLVDLTDNRSATLYLSTSLSKIQVESEGIYQPDYSQGDGQVITPSLYFGQTEANFNEIIYKIDGVEVESINNKLYITKNLEKTILITATIPEATDINGVVYNNIEGQIELVKMSNPKENFLPIIEYTRDAFNDREEEAIILTAILYKGGQKYNNGLSYKWTNTSSFDENNNPEILGDTETLTVQRAEVDNITTFICEITVEEQNKSYAARVTLRDWTDPLSSQIISSQGLYIPKIEGNLELTCKIFKGINEINSKDEESSDFSYNWLYSLEKDIDDTPKSLGKTEKKVIISPKEISELTSPQYVTFYCQATQESTGEKTSSQITVVISPEIKIILEPKEIFLSCDKNGSLKEENFEQIVNFKITDASGNLLPLTEREGINIPSIDNITIDFETPPEGWAQSIKIKINKENSNQLSNSSLIKIPYIYFGVEESEELYLIKSIQGEMGEQGEQGEAAIYNHIRSNTSIITKKIIEKESTENNGKYEPIIQYSPKILTFNFWKTEGSNTTLQEIYWRYYIDNDTPIEYKLEDNSYISSSEFSLTLGQGENEISPKSFIRVEAFIQEKDENGNNITTIIDSEQIEIISEEQQLIITASNDTITVPYSFDDENGWSGAIENASTTIRAYYGNTAVQGATFSIEPCIEGDELQYEGIRQDEDGSYLIKITNWGGSVEKEKRRRIITVTVTYGQYEIKKDIELIKVFNGQGVEGEEKFYALSNNGKTAPAENDVRWVDSVTEFPTDDLIYINYSFLWVKTILYFSDGTKTIGYSVFGWDKEKKESFNISNIIEEYAFVKNSDIEEKYINNDTLIITFPKDFNLEWFSTLEKTITEQTLFARYSFTKIGEEKQETPIYRAKDIKDLNLFLQYANILIGKYGIDLFASSVTEEEGEEGEEESNSNITYAETVMGIRAGEIKAVVEESDGEKTVQSYLTFNTEGLTIGSENSDYYSQILNSPEGSNFLDAGFYIKYNNIEADKKEDVAVLNSLGLRAGKISCQLNDISYNNSVIILGTNYGGLTFCFV